jgi:hypothetical protein
MGRSTDVRLACGWIGNKAAAPAGSKLKTLDWLNGFTAGKPMFRKLLSHTETSKSTEIQY